MEISEQTIIELVKSQSANTQAIVDLRGSLERSIPYLVQTDKDLAKDIKGVERKVWYFGGVGSAVGFALSHLGVKFLGGK